MGGRQTDDNQDQVPMQEIKLLVREEYYRAFHRCLWMLVHETGQDRLAIMEKMVHDFLVRHGC